MTRARLIPTRTPERAEGLVLVLHGGASRRGDPRVSPAQLSVLRMIPVASRIAHAGRGRLAVYRLLNSSRGWDTHHTPVDDARWGLAEVADRYPGVPACLVGHSLGGRAAILAGDAPTVRGVVALNPWVYPDDRADLRGRRVLVVHGSEDRIASPARSRVVADRLARTADSVDYETIEGGKHAMLRHGGAFERAAADFTRATLLGPS